MKKILTEKIKTFLSEYFLFFISVIVALLTWEIITRHFEVPSYLLPAPSRIFQKLFSFRELLLQHSLITLQEIIAGFFLGSVFAILLAIGMSYSKILEKVFYPPMIISQTFPKLALAPLFVVWFGFGFLPKIVMAALISFFPVAVNTIRGLQSVDPLALDFMNSLSASRAQIFLKLRLPSALPYIFASLKVSMTLSIVGAVIGEFAGSSAGLGHLIMVANSELATDLLFAALFMLGLMGITLFIIIERLEKHFLYWHESLNEFGANL